VANKKFLDGLLIPYFVVIWTKRQTGKIWETCPTIGAIKFIQMRSIDIHIHGVGGYDTRTGSEDDILKIAEALGSHGVSEIIPAIYPSSVNEMRKNMMAVRKAMEKQKGILNPLLPTGNPLSPPFSKGGMGGFEKAGRRQLASSPPFNSPLTKGGHRGVRGERVKAPNSKLARIIGIHLEGPFLNPLKCGALDLKTFVEPSEKNLQKLLEGFEDIVKIMTVAPEIKGAAKLIKKVSDMGIIVSMGHSDATFSEAEAGFHAGAKGITHIFNAMRGFHHREPGIAGFGLINKEIYIEVIADPFHLHPKTLELVFKTKNPKKIIIVSDSVKETNSPPSPPYKGGVQRRTQKIVKAVSDAHGKLQGGSMTIVESSKKLIKMGFNERIIMNCITKNPGRYLQR
jgi:N-acetylglucosamine-6-phosphate deacetylase